MFSINWNDITISRGNSASFTANLYENGEPYTLSQGDTLTFNAESNGESLFQLTADSDATFTFLPETTAGIEPGDYKYDIKLTTSDGEEYHPIGLSILAILPVAPEPAPEPDPEPDPEVE